MARVDEAITGVDAVAIGKRCPRGRLERRLPFLTIPASRGESA